jgi:hypothetical protein
MSQYTCPLCDSEFVSPHRKKARKFMARGGRAYYARMYVCGNCKHRFIVVSFVASGKVAAQVEERLEDEH